MSLIPVSNSSAYSKAKGINENVDKTSHIEYKDVLVNKKCLRHSMNRVQSESH